MSESSSESQLARAERLGHHIRRVLAAGPPLPDSPPPTQPESGAGKEGGGLGKPAGSLEDRRSGPISRNTDAAIQRAIGFELEMKVSLSRKGKGLVTSRKALAAMNRSELKDDQAFEVEDGTVFSWDSDQEGASMKLAESFPLNDKGAGRWVAQPRGGRVSAKVSEEEHQFFDPLLDKTDKVSSASKSQPFSVVEDFNNDIAKEMNPLVRSAHTAIVELVTEPRDELLSPREFAGPMESAALAAKTIESKTDQLTKRIPANAVFPDARQEMYLGVSLLPEENQFQSTSANVQATFGVQLAGVPTLFEQTAMGKNRALGEQDLIGRAMKAAGMAAGMAKKSRVKVGPRLEGLLHLIALYLIAGGERAGNILKNFTPFLIRNHITTNRILGLGPEAETLDEPAVRTLEKSVIAAAGRNPSHQLIFGEQRSPTVELWVRQALVGEIDQDPFMPLLGDMRKIGPEPVGPEGKEQGTVLEERNVPKLEGGQGALPPSDWVPLAEEFQSRFRKLNAPLGGLGGEEAEQPSQPSTSTTPPSFGGQLGQVQAPPPPAALPEFGPGLLIGTEVLLGGKLKGTILEVNEEDGLYKIAFAGRPAMDLKFTAPNMKVVAVPETT